MGWNKNIRGLGAAAFAKAKAASWVVLAGKMRVQAAQKDEAGSAEQKAFVRGELI